MDHRRRYAELSSPSVDNCFYFSRLKLKPHFQIWMENGRNSLICLWMEHSSGTGAETGLRRTDTPRSFFLEWGSTAGAPLS